MAATMCDMSVSNSMVLPSSLNVDVYPVYIDHVGFRLKGTFHDNPSTRSTPAFLFCPPLPIEYVNDMPSIQYPLSGSLFYWSFDHIGKHRIAKGDWEKFNIPKLKLRTCIGSYWKSWEYNFVRDFLSSRSYDLDGRQYARDHSHPELIQGE